MKFNIQREDILHGLHQAAQITPTKTGAVFLRSVWLKVEADKLQIMATDSNIEFYGIYNIDVDQEGLVGVNARHLYDLIRRLHPGDLQFQVEEDTKKLIIKQNKKKYVIPINENYWFQPLLSFPEENSVFWRGEYFTNIIDSVYFSISDDEVMRAINCMIIKYSENDQKIELCGLNGHKLALYQIDKNGLDRIIPDKGILIMKKYVGDLRRILPLGEIEVNITNNRFYCRSADKMQNISIPLSMYEFPDYKGLLTKYISDNPTNMNINKQSLLDALNRIYIFNTENSICTFFEFDGNHLHMNVRSDEKGEAKEIIDVEFNGDIKKIAFPTKDLIEILSHFKSENLNFNLTSSEGPCFVSGNDDPGYNVLVMPMKISEDVVYSEADM
jgi:DNA polymerase-3 subunit beta